MFKQQTYEDLIDQRCPSRLGSGFQGLDFCERYTVDVGSGICLQKRRQSRCESTPSLAMGVSIVMGNPQNWLVYNDYNGKYYLVDIWLVVWNMNFMNFHSVGNIHPN